MNRTLLAIDSSRDPCIRFVTCVAIFCRVGILSQRWSGLASLDYSHPSADTLAPALSSTNVFGGKEALRNVISLTLETRRFRVRVQDCIAYLETSERHAWIFRDQYTLPISPTALDGRHEFAKLTTAVRCFERHHGGDQSLREALTGRDWNSEGRPLRQV